MERDGETQVALTDSDSRRMRMGSGATAPCYNVQAAVDAKHNMIVELAVTNECNDRRQLHHMSKEARNALGASNLEVLADEGYSNGAEIKKCDDEGITTYVPLKTEGMPKRNGVPTDDYQLSKFRYDDELNCYICPEGQTLTQTGQGMRDGAAEMYYGTKACSTCDARGKCTSSEKGRRLTRRPWADNVEALNKRLQKHPEKMKLRQKTVEPVFGILKATQGFTHFLVRGLEKAGAEAALAGLAHNMKRAINILTAPRLLDAIGSSG